MQRERTDWGAWGLASDPYLGFYFFYMMLSGTDLTTFMVLVHHCRDVLGCLRFQLSADMSWTLSSTHWVLLDLLWGHSDFYNLPIKLEWPVPRSLWLHLHAVPWTGTFNRSSAECANSKSSVRMLFPLESSFLGHAGTSDRKTQSNKECRECTSKEGDWEICLH